MWPQAAPPLGRRSAAGCGPDESSVSDEPEEPEPTPRQRAIERAQYRQRRIAELQDSPSLLAAEMDDWCREDIGRAEASAP